MNHKNTSGAQSRYWECFDTIHEFMHKKPEITPVATCTSSAGYRKPLSSQRVNYFTDTADEETEEDTEAEDSKVHVKCEK